MMSVSRPTFGVAKPFAQFAPEGEQLGLLDVGEDDVLVMAVAHLAEAVAVGQVGDGVQLLVGDVARRHAGGLERQRHGDVAGLLVGEGVAAAPAGEAGVLGVELGEGGVLVFQGLVGRVDEVRGHALELRLGEGARAVLEVGPFGLDLLGEDFRGQRLDQDLDARLVLVVAAAIAVVHAQDGVQVGQQVLPRQEFIDEVADDRGTAQAAADRDAEAQLAGVVLHRLQADVVHLDGGAVAHGAVDGDLELARQVGEFGVEGRPLADDLAPGARIDQLVAGDAGELVGGGVADAVAAGLDRVHLHGGQLGEDFRHVFQLRPVELDVLAGADVGVALVVVAGDLRQLAHLLGVQQAVGNGHAQHGRIALDVQAVLQAQRAEFLAGQFARQVAAGLIAELLDAVLYDPLIVFVIYVHESSCCQAMRRTAFPSAHGNALHAEWAHDTSSYLCAKVMFEYMARTFGSKPHQA